MYGSVGAKIRIGKFDDICLKKKLNQGIHRVIVLQLIVVVKCRVDTPFDNQPADRGGS